jgi:ATP adenylyltransferase
MRYVGKREPSAGCIFCARFAATDDVAHLILHRAEHSFVIMNLYPYNTGHVMVVPNAHVPVLDDLDDDTLAEMAVVLRGVTRGLRRALDCDGFNVGLNIGAVAGAGVADHLHQHVVPRWHGDVNFMPVVGQTMVLPELIPVTYAKLRVEISREFAQEAVSIPIVLFSATRSEVQLQLGADGWQLPTMAIPDDEPIWRTAMNAVHGDSGNVEIVGVSSAEVATGDHLPALILEANDDTGATLGPWIPYKEALALLPEMDRRYLAAAGH